jgi:2-hydroxychromene-2-carboxylate isomerase
MTTRAPASEEQLPLEAGIRDRLERLSALLGVPSATMASHAIEHWVAEQERTLALIESLADPVGGEMGSRLREMLRTGLFARQQKMAGGPVLTEAEVDAIADQEKLSTTAAAGLGGALLQSKEGIREIERFIHENIENAKAQGQSEKAKDLERILDRFKKAQPF